MWYRTALLFTAVTVAAQQPTFRTTVPVVIVPTTVTDHRGKYIDGLEAGDFVLLEDGKGRTIKLDHADLVSIPLTVVFLVQANNTAPAVLRKVVKIGSMIEPLITGTRGSAAVLAFGSELRVVQPFTSDAQQITNAFRRIEPEGGKTARMLDAVSAATAMFNDRPNDERRAIFIISESGDRGSKTKLNDAAKAVQLEGAAVFPMVFSAYTTAFTTKPSDTPPPGYPDLKAAITEPLRLAKADAASTLARYSGGRKTSFTTLQGLETDISSLGEELHSQYLLSYTNDTCAPGLHRIEVKVKSHPEAIVRARYGYWTDEESCRK